MTISEWFAGNKKASAEVEKWVSDNRCGEDVGGIRGLLIRFHEVYDYPFRDHTALWDFIKKTHGTYSVEKVEPVAPRSDRDIRQIESGQDFFCTSAVSNCYADPKFLSAVEHWKADHNAKIIVNGVRYVNPTRPGEEVKDEWYDPALTDYMLNQEIRPHPRVSIMPTKIQATTSNPLPPRLAGLTKGRHVIFGHPQLAMKTVPTLHGEAKVMWSTGAVTKPHYSDTLAGTLGAFHHGLGGVIVQIRGDDILMREVTWDGTGFMDLETYYTANGADGKFRAPLALVMGDIHVRLTDDRIMESTFGEDSIFGFLGHQRIVLHDLPDFRTINPHEWQNQLTRAALSTVGRTDLRAEVEDIAKWVNDLPTAPEVIVVRSNHDEFLTRWLQGGEKNVEPHNRLLYHQLSARMLEHHEAHGEFPITLEEALKGKLSRDVRFLRFDESFRIAGVEMGQHGHLGPNGARGSIINYARLATRTIVGHTHSPGIWQGCYQVGHSAVPRHGYNVGPSGWWNAHTTLHFNGQRQMHLICRSGAWRG